MIHDFFTHQIPTFLFALFEKKKSSFPALLIPINFFFQINSFMNNTLFKDGWFSELAPYILNLVIYALV